MDLAMKWFLLILALVMPSAAYALDHPAGDVPDYTLHVTFDVPSSVIRGVSAIPVVRDRELKLHTGRLSVTDATIDGQKAVISVEGETTRITPSRSGSLIVTYEGFFKELSNNEKPSDDVISDKGIFLTGTWYPKPDQMCRYHLTVALPDGYEAISEAETIEKSTRNDDRPFFSLIFPILSMPSPSLRRSGIKW